MSQEISHHDIDAAISGLSWFIELVEGEFDFSSDAGGEVLNRAKQSLEVLEKVTSGARIENDKKTK